MGLYICPITLQWPNADYYPLILPTDKIAFDESLPMFNNSGNDTFEFLARYERGFSVQSGKQVEEEVDDGWKFTGEYSSVSIHSRLDLVDGRS